jgi:predicted GNAT family N-acyltransferase
MTTCNTQNSPQVKAQSPFNVSIVDWIECGSALSQVRYAVFVREQGVPAEVELDENDANPAHCIHAAAFDADNQVIATGRLVFGGELVRIGRMAVLKSWRGNGVGVALLECLAAEAKRRGHRELMLHAQTHATAFYFKHGFLSHGGEFLEASIPHQEMRRAL